LVLFRWRARRSPQNKSYFSFGDCVGSHASGCNFPLPVFEKVQSETNLFSGVVAFAGPFQLEFSGNGLPTIAQGELVSGDYFSTLGVRPALGRLIGPADDVPTASPVTVLSYAYWQRAYGGSKSAIGGTIVLSGVPFTIVGVASRKFTGLSPGKTQDVWLPIAASQRLSVGFWGMPLKNIRSIRLWWVVLVGKLKPGISLARAQAAASVVFYNEVMNLGGKPIFRPQDDPGITLMPAVQGLTGMRGLFAKPLFILMSVVGIILLIACANVAGLLLVRGRSRKKEMAVRLAIGASRTRIARQLLTESVLLFVLGGLLGVFFAYWTVHALAPLMWGHLGVPISFAITPDLRVLAFAVSVTLLTGIVFGLGPALGGTRLNLTPALKENGSTYPNSTGPALWRLRLGDVLVVAQVGLCLMVLAGAGLLVRTLQKLRDTDPGFDTRNLLVFGIDPTSLGYKDPQIRNLYQEMRARLGALPGVTSVSYSSFPMLDGWSSNASVYIEGRSRKATTVDFVSPGPDFFHTLRLPLLEGRAFTAEDFQQALGANEAESKNLAGPSTPVLVNRLFAREFFANQNPVGKRMWEEESKKHAWEIVGVVGDAKITDLRQAIDPTVYVPNIGGAVYFALRVSRNPSALIPAVLEAVNRINSHLPLFDIRTQSQEINDTLDQGSFMLVVRLSSVFGLLGLLLASVGLYGLLSYEVGRRRREIGIRMALGAQKGDVFRMVIAQGLKLALVGVAIGIAGVLAMMRFLSSLLYGVKPADPATFAVVSLVLTSAALMACYMPARRGAEVDPMAALRNE
jgi:predicted permease